MKTISASKMQLVVLRELSTHTGLDGFCAVRFSRLAEATGLSIRLVRLACRALKRKGLADYRTTINQDYFISGSGYSCTDEGAEYLKAITPPLSEENNNL